MNDQSLRRSALIYTAVVLALTTLAALIRAIGLFFFYDASIGYFSGALFSALAYLVPMGALLVLGILSLVFFRGEEIGYAKNAPLAVKIVSAACALLFFLWSVQGLTSGAPWYTTVLGLFSALYFLLALTADTRTPALPIAGLCVILRLIVALGNSHFDITVAMNSPDKLALQLALLSGMIFTVCELRARIDTPRTALWFFSAGIAATLLIGNSLPTLLAAAADRIYRPDAPLLSATLLAFGLYAAVRLLTVALNPTPAQEEPETELTEEEPESPEEETESPEPIDEPTDDTDPQ